MTHLMQMELTRAFKNKRLVLAAFLAIVSMVYGIVRAVQIQSGYPMNAINIWQAILTQGRYGYFAALMAALPYADTLITDKSHQFIYQILARCGYREYIFSKIWANILVGAAAVAAPAIVLLGFCLVLFRDTPAVIPTLSLSAAELLHPNLIPPGSGLTLSPGSYVLISLLFLVVFGACYALMGMGISFLTRNPYLALGLPFLAYCFGSYILPTSVRLQWLGSTSESVIPTGNLLAPILQYLIIGLFFTGCVFLFGKKERQVLN
jgi:hypothetical protein